MQDVLRRKLDSCVDRVFPCQLCLGGPAGYFGRVSSFYCQEENPLVLCADLGDCIGAYFFLVSSTDKIVRKVFVCKSENLLVQNKIFFFSLFFLFSFFVCLFVCFSFSPLKSFWFSCGSHGRASWTSAFNLSFTKSLCTGVGTISLLWIQLATPVMYIGMWFILLLLHWIFRSTRAGRRRGGYEVGLEPSVAGSSRSSYRMSLMQHLIDDRDNHRIGEMVEGKEEEEEEVAAAEEESSLPTQQRQLQTLHGNSSSTESRPTTSFMKQLCRRFQFLRAFEFLLLFLYETLTEQALQLVNCVRVGSCGHVLAEYPDVQCRENSQYTPLLVVAILIIFYTAGFPVGLCIFLRRLQLRSNNNSNKDVDKSNISYNNNNKNKNNSNNPSTT